MPILAIFPGLTTAPFASDDLHIICLILGVYRAILLLCPDTHAYRILHPTIVRVYHRWHTGIWCTNSLTLIFAGKFGLIPVYPPMTIASQASWYDRENAFVQTSLAKVEIIITVAAMAKTQVGNARRGRVVPILLHINRYVCRRTYGIWPAIYILTNSRVEWRR